MNTIISNLLQAKNNPHVFWPLLAAVALRVGLQATFTILAVWMPGHVGQLAQTQDILEPYNKDLIALLTSYATVCAAKSGPDTPTPPPPAPTPITPP